jgi:lipoyl synthase
LTLKQMIDHLIQTSLSDLQAEAFRIRKEHFGDELTFSAPGVVSYHAHEIPSQRNRFAAISVTGDHCDLQCGHCRGKLLDSMVPAETPDVLLQVTDRLRSEGSLGVLISGGADRHGEVPLQRFIPTIARIKQRTPDFRVIVHTGLLQEETAVGLKHAGVDQILIDVIGDNDTIREVYHLNKRVEDYEKTLVMLKGMGHRLAPHIVIGHHMGEIRGEWRALEMISRIGVETIVFVVFKPIVPDIQGGTVQIPYPDEVSRIAAVARIMNPRTPIRMGCIRPAHHSKGEMEKGCINSGVNTVAYPLQGTIDYAREIGLKTSFVEMCCSLI